VYSAIRKIQTSDISLFNMSIGDLFSIVDDGEDREEDVAGELLQQHLA
jgi:hypothetical protein